MGEGLKRAFAAARATRQPKRRIKQNQWGNWYGYENNRKAIYFANTPTHSQQQQAEYWLEHGKLPTPDTK